MRNKSSVYRGYISTAKVWGTIAIVGTAITLPTGICLIEEILCISKL